MNSYKPQILFLLSLLVSVFNLSPSANAQKYLNYMAGSNVASTKYTFNSNKEIEGSPYYLQNWVLGEVQFINNSTEKVKSMNIDTYNNIVVYKYEKADYSLPTKLIKSVHIGYETFSSETFEGKDLLCKSIAGDSAMCLLLNIKTTIVKGRESNGVTPDKKDQFVHKEAYYISANNKLYSVRPNKGKEVLEVFYAIDRELSEKLKTYLEEEKIKINSVEALIIAVEFCSNLDS